jgi:hypothetical protein
VFRHLIVFLTLIAVTVLAVLPAGQLPRVAGRCGKSLCECPIELVVVVVQETEACAHCVSVPAPRYLTLTSELKMSAAEEHIAFFPALSSCSMPHRVKIVSLENCLLFIPRYAYFSLSRVHASVEVPPPRFS